VTATPDATAREFGPLTRRLAAHYFEPVRFTPESEAQLRALHQKGFVVHVMRTTAWVNYLYLAWAMIRRGLPPVRAVVNLRRWFSRPWRLAAQRGDFEVRFTYARRQQGSGLIFLRRSALGSAAGKAIDENPFPALVAMARKTDRTVFLVPELFVWEKWLTRLKPGLLDFVFGSPDAPGFVHSLAAFWRNYRRAQFRMGEPIDLRKFIDQNPGDADEVIARKVRGALLHHLTRETRAVFGPPAKPTDRLLEEAMRDKVFRRSVEDQAQLSQRALPVVLREAAKDLDAIAAKPNTTVLAVAAPILSWVFNRIYDGMEVDEPGLDRALKAGAHAPVVLCPSHKSHIDYLVLSWVLWQHGYSPPLVAAGANLSFFPLGWFLRRVGAFFLRRSFRDDRVYTAAFRAYVKKLVHDGILQEFFPEGGRSRTGKLLQPKLGMLTWEVDAVLEGARPDLHFVPVAIDYEKVVEGGSYSKELAGGEKRPEDLRALLSAPKVLRTRYGRIHLTFDEPISLAELMASRGLRLGEDLADAPKKALVRALGHRVMYGISRASTVTPHALLSAALLAHRRRGITAREVGEHVGLLRRLAELERVPLSKTLKDAPSDPTVLGPIQDAMAVFVAEGLVKAEAAKGETIYSIDPLRRAEMAFAKNTLSNWVAPVSLVTSALLADPNGSVTQVGERALFASRLLKLEFVFRTGTAFDTLFHEAVERLSRLGLVVATEHTLALAPESHVRGWAEFLADLTHDCFETYELAVQTLADVAAGTLDKKGFVKAALENGRSAFLAGTLDAPEALSKSILENALAVLLEQGYLAEDAKRLKLGPASQTPQAREAFAARVKSYLRRP